MRLFGADVIFSPADQGSNGAVLRPASSPRPTPRCSCRSSTAIRPTRYARARHRRGDPPRAARDRRLRGRPRNRGHADGLRPRGCAATGPTCWSSRPSRCPARASTGSARSRTATRPRSSTSRCSIASCSSATRSPCGPARAGARGGPLRRRLLGRSAARRDARCARARGPREHRHGARRRRLEVPLGRALGRPESGFPSAWSRASGRNAPARAGRRDDRPCRLGSRSRPAASSAARSRASCTRSRSASTPTRAPTATTSTPGPLPHRAAIEDGRRRRRSDLPLAHDVAGPAVAPRHGARNVTQGGLADRLASERPARHPRLAPGRRPPPEGSRSNHLGFADHGLAEALACHGAARRVAQAGARARRSARAGRGSAAPPRSRRRRAPARGRRAS